MQNFQNTEQGREAQTTKTGGVGSVSLICILGKRCVLFIFKAAECVSRWVSAAIGYAGCREQ